MWNMNYGVETKEKDCWDSDEKKNGKNKIGWQSDKQEDPEHNKGKTFLDAILQTKGNFRKGKGILTTLVKATVEAKSRCV